MTDSCVTNDASACLCAGWSSASFVSCMNDELFELVFELQLFAVDISDEVVDDDVDGTNALILKIKLESVVILQCC